MFQLMMKLKRLKSLIKELNKGRYNDVKKKAEYAQRKLTDLQLLLQQNPTHFGLLEEEKVASLELRQLQ